MPGGKIQIDVEPNLQGFDGKVASGLRGIAGPLGTTAKGIGLAIGAGVAVAAVGFKKVIDIGIQYQSSLNDLQSVTRATDAQMAAVGRTAKALGSDMSLPATSAADAAAAMTELAKGGLSVEASMTAAKGTLQLAAAAQIEAGRAAEIQSQALNAFGLSADSAGHVADVLANAANAATGEITDFSQALSQVGAVAHQFGLSIDETTTALGLFANAGIQGSDAGTLLKSALLAMANPSGPAQKAIKALGLETYDATGKFVGLKSIFEQLHEASGRMTEQQYQQATATVFGSDAVRLAGIAANTTGDQWDAMATSIGRAGGASEVAAAKTKGLGGAIEGFKSQLETSAIEVFEVIGPPLEAGVRKGAEAVAKYGPAITNGLKNAAQAGKDVGPGIAKSVGDGVKEIESVAKRLVTPFEDAAKNVADRGIDLAKTAVGGFVDVARDAVDVAEPLARGAADIAKGFTTATGPIGAGRTALELAYDAAQAVLTVVKPLAAGLGEVASFAGSLPGPVQAAAAALLALKFGPAILGGLRNALSGAGRDAQEASGRVGILGRTLGVVTAPARLVASSLGAAAGSVRQFAGEAAVQRGIADQAGQSIGRMASASAAFNTSTIPAVAAARSFRDQTVAIRDGAAAAGQPINSLSASIGTLVERSSTLSAMRESFDNAANGAERFGRISGIAAAAGTGLRSAATGLVGALGGPWGIAIAGAAVGLSLLADKQQEAAQKAQQHKQQVDDLAAAYQKSGGVIDDNIRQTNNKALADKNVAENAKVVGLSFDVYSLAANGNVTALDAVSKASTSFVDNLGKQANLYPEQVKGLQDISKELLTNGGDYASVADRVKQLTTNINAQGEMAGTTRILSDEQRSLLTRVFDANGALGQQVSKNREAHEAYLLLAASAEQTSMSTIKLWDAQNRQAASARNAASASLSYRDAVAQLKVAQDGSLSARTQYGVESKQYQDALRGEEHAILNVIEAKRKDAEANSKANSDLGKQHEGVVASSKEAVALAATYKGVLPDALKVFIANISAANAAAAGLKIEMNEAGEAVYRLPDGRVIKIEGDTKPIKEALDAVPAYVDGVKPSMVVSANIDPATGKINSAVTFADGSTGVITVDGNKDPVTGKTVAAVQFANGSIGYMTIDALNEAANNKTVAAVRFADGRVGFIKVDANTGAAEAAINHVARDRTVTITTSFRDVGGAGFGNPTGPAARFARGSIAKAMAGGGTLTPMRGGMADIVPPNTWRVIGDRMRDDEAYIPINRTQRSLSLLHETARRMGFDLMRRYATGGIASASNTAPSIASLLAGPLRLSGSLDIGGALVPLVDARIQAADHADGDALNRGRRY